jgi:hypothetical protein
MCGLQAEGSVKVPAGSSDELAVRSRRANRTRGLLMDQGYIVTTTIMVKWMLKPKKIKTWHQNLERAKRSIEYANKLQLYKNSTFKISRPGEGVVEII